MPSPYKTNCFDYNKIGCTSKQDCLDKCYIKLSLIHCINSLGYDLFIDKNNDKDKITSGSCNSGFKTEFCTKYKSLDCFNEYYSFKVVSDQKLERSNYIALLIFNKSFKSNNPNAKSDINLMLAVRIYFNMNEPDTIYTYSPQQYPIEFICFIGGLISLWTGFSVISTYSYGKRFFRRNQNKVESIKTVDGAVNSRKIVLISKLNNKISLQTKLNKVMKVMKIKKKNQVSKFTSDNCA